MFFKSKDSRKPHSVKQILSQKNRKIGISILVCSKNFPKNQQFSGQTHRMNDPTYKLRGNTTTRYSEVHLELIRTSTTEIFFLKWLTTKRS